ncbi:MAG TPA: response regulator [Chloroflexota bacterium]|jgi:DNA-binding NarL/FixJ family response regulator|nr:response regulator [Chloroflexota bacterium]
MAQRDEPIAQPCGANAGPPIRVALVDDAVLMTQVVSGLLQDEDGIEVVGTAASGEEGIALVQRVRPDVVLLDLDLPDLDGIQVAARLRCEAPTVRIVMLTGYDMPWAWDQLDAIGVHGYVLKHASIELLVAAIRDAAAG